MDQFIKAEKELEIEQIIRDISNKVKVRDYIGGIIADEWILEGTRSTINRVFKDIGTSYGKKLYLLDDYINKGYILGTSNGIIAGAFPNDLIRTEHDLHLGLGNEGRFILDLREYGNILISGLSGYGKSACIENIIKSVDGYAELVVIDPHNCLPNCISDIRQKGSELKALQNIEREMKMRLLGKSYNKRIVVVIDEVDSRMDTLGITIDNLLKECRKVGISVICATHSGHHKDIPKNIINGFQAYIGFRLNTISQARMLNVSGAENIEEKGRAIVRTNNYVKPLICYFGQRV